MAQTLCVIGVLYAVFPDFITAYPPALYNLLHQKQSLLVIQEVLLLRAVEHAEKQMQNNTVYLPDYNPPGHVGKHSHPDGVLMTAFIGEEINLTCTPEPAVGHSAAGFVDQVTWSHNGKPAGTNFPRNTQSSNSARDSNIWHISTVTYRSAGKYECYQRCLENPASSCVRTTYTLRAVPRGIDDVFLEPMQLLPTSNATQFSFSCTLMTECSPSSDPYFVWKYGGMFIAGPKGHFLRRASALQPKRKLGVQWRTTQYNHSTSNQQVYSNCFEIMTLTVLRPTFRRGDIECWARTDPTREQWFVIKKRVY